MGRNQQAMKGRAFTALRTGSRSAQAHRPALNAAQMPGLSRRRLASASRASVSGAPLPFLRRKTAWPPLFPVLIVSGGKYWPGAASVFVPSTAR